MHSFKKLSLALCIAAPLLSYGAPTTTTANPSKAAPAGTATKGSNLVSKDDAIQQISSQLSEMAFLFGTTQALLKKCGESKLESDFNGVIVQYDEMLKKVLGNELKVQFVDGQKQVYDSVTAQLNAPEMAPQTITEACKQMKEKTPDALAQIKKQLSMTEDKATPAKSTKTEKKPSVKKEAK